ncbi:MAG TPA: CcmD family protein [Longimicrobium sp.]|nr:CcmD family protein [Longimicrobium sp.]
MIQLRFHRLERLALAAALLAIALAPGRALAQDATTAPSAALAQDAAPRALAQEAALADSATGAPLVAAPAPSTESSGLPVNSGPPRTLRAYWHVWIAFTLAWLLLFGYAVSLGRRFGRVERELDAMRGTS